ncbi:ferredoxin [Mycobacterium sp. CVI_P3]|uniref:Ferredoxin n=1 Tax=Mycobacterium pinniadriaticum TaxID=2994102 RepID=A0ABT3SDR7_9MYCO|nr:ferredoxin [Mycobacterium pinniadriaticum]MCX2930636.1 ferredoxin [Mycobacterium pinniadriaticum]MCX2937060.1 ferredoxin [Mycobacterium pinniadriaticum]
MTVAVDPERCMGHGQCFAYGPDVYKPDDEGYCVLTASIITSTLLEQAVAGAQACPEAAITVGEVTNV